MEYHANGGGGGSWHKYRRIRGDMIEVYKILTNKYDSNNNNNK